VTTIVIDVFHRDGLPFPRLLPEFPENHGQLYLVGLGANPISTERSSCTYGAEVRDLIWGHYIGLRALWDRVRLSETE